MTNYTIILSPAKALNFEKKSPAKKYTMPVFQEKSSYLIEKLREYSIDDLMTLMKISPALAELNFERYLKWNLPFTPDNSKQAISAFVGHAYAGL